MGSVVGHVIGHVMAMPTDPNVKKLKKIKNKIKKRNT
jgi:hypothetical protein